MALRTQSRQFWIWSVSGRSHREFFHLHGFRQSVQKIFTNALTHRHGKYLIFENINDKCCPVQRLNYFLQIYIQTFWNDPYLFVQFPNFINRAQNYAGARIAYGQCVAAGNCALGSIADALNLLDFLKIFENFCLTPSILYAIESHLWAISNEVKRGIIL